MALDGISAMAGTAARPPAEQSGVRQVIAQASDAAAPRSEAADAFRETLGNIHDNAMRFQSEPGMQSAKPDAVEAARNEILPSPYRSQPKAGGTSATTPTEGSSGSALADTVAMHSKSLQEGNKALRQSFDHAIFVTLVSQVISGVSQTTSTLVRQQ